MPNRQRFRLYPKPSGDTLIPFKTNNGETRHEHAEAGRINAVMRVSEWIKNYRVRKSVDIVPTPVWKA